MSRRVDGPENREVRNSGFTQVVVRAYRMSRPQASVLNAIGKWTMAGCAGCLGPWCQSCLSNEAERIVVTGRKLSMAAGMEQRTGLTLC